MTIAILGGYGDVGSATCQFLQKLKLEPLRIGGRNIEREHPVKGSDISFQTVDYKSESSLETFLKDCSIVVNCAGPSYEIGDRVAKAATKANAAYVDVAGDESLFEQLDSVHYKKNKLTAVLSAGLQPGLSALFPRYVVEQDFTEVTDFISYFCVLDRFTKIAADDYLKGSNEPHFKPLAAWRNGHVQSAALKRQADVELPYVPNAVTLLPFFNAESERLAKELSIQNGSWYNAVSGPQILNAFNTIHGLPQSKAQQALCRASELDLAGRQPYAVMLVQLQGYYHKEARTRTVALRGKGNTELTGAIAALTVQAIVQGQISVGCHYCAQVLNAKETLSQLKKINAINSLITMNSTIEELMIQEEGVL